MEEPYQNREIDERFTDIKQSLDRIENQTIHTNGRVRWLEKMVWLAVGGLGVLTTLVIPTILAFIQDNKL